MQSIWPYQLLLILIAPAVGSFLGVLVERLPRGQSVMGRSRCDGCDTPLRSVDLVPVISALMLRGRCRSCGAKFPGHLLRIEIAALAAGILVALTPSDPLSMFLTAAYLWCLIALFYCDLLWFRLPDQLTGALFVLGLALAMLDPWRGWVDGLLSAAVASGAFLAIRIGYRALRGREGLGLGDVKLMAGIGAAVGWAMVPVVTLLAALLGLSVVAARAVQDRTLPKGSQRLPLGTYLCAATAMLLLVVQLGLAPSLNF